MTSNRLRLCAAAVALLAGLAAASATEARSPTGTRYSLSATKQCLTTRGLTVRPTRRSDARRRAFSDLAQHTSFETRVHGAAVLFAFAKSNADARFLVELLTVPHDPYRIRVDRNVVLMYRPAAARAATVVKGCFQTG